MTINLTKDHNVRRAGASANAAIYRIAWLGRSRRIALVALRILCVCIVLSGIGALGTKSPSAMLLAAIVLVIVAFSLFEPMTVPLISMLTMVVVQRVGGASVNLSLSDFMLFGAFWVAVVLTPRPFSPTMRIMLWLSVIYQACAAFAVVGNVYSANLVEYFHAWLLVAGAMIVGWAIAASGKASLGMTLMLGPAVIIAVLACYTGLTQFVELGSFQPVYLNWPFGMQKNFTGDVLGVAAVALYTRPIWLRWPQWLALASFWVCSLGVLATQARQALIGLGVAIIVVALRRDPDHKRNKLILLPLVAAAFLIAALVKGQLNSNNQFNSSFQRLSWYQDALLVWHQNPWIGLGLRWWVAGRSQFTFQPPNAELEVVTSVGLVGLVGFLILIIGGLVVLWRVPPRYGTLAFAVLLNRFVQTQFDLFWVSVQVSIPFVIIGICLGTQEHARRAAEAEERVRALAPPSPSPAVSNESEVGAPGTHGAISGTAAAGSR